jgi:hypothetical protein
MGFPTSVIGFIKIQRSIESAWSKIQQLPPVNEDDWPFLPREIFHVASLTDSVLSYKGEHIIHFGMCVKQIESDWDEWLTKFERLFKSMDAEEAFVMLRLPCWDSGEFDGYFYYKWELSWPEDLPIDRHRSDNREWTFKGGPRNFY